MARELEHGALDILIPCPSTSGHKSRGKYLLGPGSATYSEEKILQFFGQVRVLAVCIIMKNLGLELHDQIYCYIIGIHDRGRRQGVM